MESQEVQENKVPQKQWYLLYSYLISWHFCLKILAV